MPAATAGIQASTGVRCTINGEEELITNGQAGAFSIFSNAFKPNVQWAPLLRWMVATDVLIIQIQNFSLTTRIQPSIEFGFIRKGDYPGTGG